MGRALIVIRPGVADDLDSLALLWDEFCEQSGAGAVMSGVPDVAERVRERMRESAAGVRSGSRPTFRLLVASVDGELAGFAAVSVVERGLFSASCAVSVDAIHVSSCRRKVGAGTALLREAVLFADEVGASDLIVNVAPASRESNRFYARHGFAPAMLRRSAPIGVVRRKLGVERQLDPRDVTIDLTPVQRSMRRAAFLAPRRTARLSRTRSATTEL